MTSQRIHAPLLCLPECLNNNAFRESPTNGTYFIETALNRQRRRYTGVRREIGWYFTATEPRGVPFATD